MNRKRTTIALMVALMLVSGAAVLPAQGAQPQPLLQAMKAELDRSVAALGHADTIPMYFLSYHVVETRQQDLSASYGAIVKTNDDHDRLLDIDLRVGDYDLDNTREIRGGFGFDFSFGASPQLPLGNDQRAIRAMIWDATDEEYKNAIERYAKIKTNVQVMVEREDTSADFSREQPSVSVGEIVTSDLDTTSWSQRLRDYSEVFKEYPFVETSEVRVLHTDDNRYFVSSEGSEIQEGQSYSRLIISCAGTCDDGMRINRYETFDAETPDGLPGDQVVYAAINRLIDELKSLLNAPLAEPYAGPAILVNRATGVYFHEIFGHRIEGHRQKSETEGQTFAKKVGEQILPKFIDVFDDPTMERFNDDFLRGYYKYDDEGVQSERVTIVKDGVLKEFLLSRSPVAGFTKSNGHGRTQGGRDVVSRQGNLMVKSSKEYPFDQLVEMLKEECRKQGKPYGLIFYDISGGFTTTNRFGPQSFKVIPLLVYKVYTDDRPMEPIRGVDIVGTPLSSFAKIIATGDDYGIFNGTCGAESGWVPVSATAPSVLVSELEVEKKFKEQEKPPILPPPFEPTKTSDAGVIGGVK